MAVKNYSPELLKVFEAGSKKPFHFDAGTHEKAKALRWRLHALRRDMRQERHWLLPLAEATIITVRKNSSVVIVQPPDQDIEEALRKALNEQSPETEKQKSPELKVVPSAENAIKDYLGKKKS